MWSVRDGRLYLDDEIVSVRRMVVEMIVKKHQGPVTDDQAQHMIRMERAISLRNISESLSRGEPAGA